MQKFESIIDVYQYLKKCDIACVEYLIDLKRRILEVRSSTFFCSSLVRLFGDLLSANDDLCITIGGDSIGVTAFICFCPGYDED